MPKEQAVFISYSHEDKKWRDELDTHLKPYLRDGSIVSRSDEQFEPGSERFKEIQSALTNSKIVVMLVSPDFLDSEFISEHELGPVLKEAEQGEVKVLWIPVRASAYKQTPLKNYQAILDPGKPLAGMATSRRDQAWVKICQEIAKAIAYGQRPDASSEATKTELPKVFLSYAWGDTSSIASEGDRQRQEVVERLCETVQAEGWQVVRDKSALRYGDMISTFIKTLGQANLVIVVLSAKYLRSPYCMKELHALYQNSRQEKREFLDRIIPLVLDDARFGIPRERIECAKYWETEYLNLKTDLDYLAEDDFRLYQNMKKWYVDVGDMLAYVDDVLHPQGFANIEKDDFAALRQMLQRRR